MANSRWTATRLPDMSGRTVVVTGASSGIGAVAARELSRARAAVVLAVRDVVKGERIAAGMPGQTDVRPLDLANLASVRAFAAGWTGDLDTLINNAGIMMVPEGRTADGFELQMGTNHLGHFALTNLLLPHVTGRVVTVSSDLHKIGGIDLDDLNWEQRTYRPLGAYCQSKLANLLFTLELQRRLAEARSAVRAVSAHPGVADTNLLGHLHGIKGALSNVLLRFVTQDIEHGALPTLFAASEDVPGAGYVGPDGFLHAKGYPEIARPSRAARNGELARRLWDVSARLTGTGSTVPIAA